MVPISSEYIIETIKLQHNNDNKQLDVIFSNEDKLLVEAPAGYGKTRTMISRIAYLLVTNKIVNPKKILALTFSVNAALKIRKDVAEKLPELINKNNNPVFVSEKISVTNYHGFCKNILKKYGYIINSKLNKNINEFRTIEEAKVEEFEDLKIVINEDEVNKLKKVENDIKSSIFPNELELEEYINIIVEKLLPLEYITHNAIILFTIYLFRINNNILKFYQNYYPLIIVDEFQDTNIIAWELLKILIVPSTKLLFLGDSLQRIYGFIGALENIMELAKQEFAMKQISLSKNYRFKDNEEMLKLDANIRANAINNEKYNYDLHIANLSALYGRNYIEEVNFIYESIIEKLNRDTNSKISILCRGRNKNAEEIEKKFVENQIDYFYGMFNEDDDDYVDFHNTCHNMFFDKFSINQVISNKALERFVQSVKYVYSTSSNKTIKSLLLLLDALKQKVIQDYTSLTYEEKYQLIMDIFENRQLKQSMEYIESRVIITTVHSAKGLEWDYVYIPDLERWMFPSGALCVECENKFTPMVYCKCQLSDCYSSDFEKKFLEELSVFYVAITRARKNVIVSASGNRLNNDGIVKNSGFSCFANLKGIRLIRE